MFAENMIISYIAELDDVAEPSIRMYLRSKSARDNRIISSISTFILTWVLLSFLGMWSHSYPFVIAALLVALVIATFTYLRHPSAAAKRIRKYIQKEHGTLIPSNTVYTLTPDQIQCASRGVTLTFCISDLSLVSEDEKRLEMRFGEKGLCIIPLRAFASPNEKAEFLAKIKSEGGAVNAATRRD